MSTARALPIVLLTALLALLTWVAIGNTFTAQAGNKSQANKRLGHKVITVSAKTNRRLQRIRLSAPAVDTLEQQVQCWNTVDQQGAATLEGHSDIDLLNQLFFAMFLTSSLYGNVIYSAAEDRPAKLQAAENTLLRGKNRLAQKAVSRRGHKMAAGLAGYSRQLKIIRAVVRAGYSIDLCLLQQQLEDNNGYESPETLFTNLGQWAEQWDAAMPPGSFQRYDQRLRRQNKIVQRAERVLSKVLAKNPKRLRKFSNPLDAILAGIDRQFVATQETMARGLTLSGWLSSRKSLESISPAIAPRQLPQLSVSK